MNQQRSKMVNNQNSTVICFPCILGDHPPAVGEVVRGSEPELENLGWNFDDISRWKQDDVLMFFSCEVLSKENIMLYVFYL